MRNSGYHDLIQWRKQSVADFISKGALAARRAAPNHLLTYAMVGAIYNGYDSNIACEDAKTIIDR